MGSLIGKFLQFLIALSAHDMIMAGYYHSMFLFLLFLHEKKYNFMLWVVIRSASLRHF